jgi:hypothetical protein
MPGPPPHPARAEVEPTARTAAIHDPEVEPASPAPVPGGPSWRPARGASDASGGSAGAAGGSGGASGGPVGAAGGTGEDKEAERGLRGLVGSGATQVGVAAALRARDASRPTEADIAAAEDHLLIVRRGWVPRDELPRPGR